MTSSHRPAGSDISPLRSSKQQQTQPIPSLRPPATAFPSRSKPKPKPFLRVGFPHLWRIGTTANAAFLASILRDPRVGPFETLLGAGTPAGAWEDLYCFYRILQAGYRLAYLPEAFVYHAHREEMTALTRQLCASRRGETAFLTLMLVRHHAFLWIPFWRLRLLRGELQRRLRGNRLFSLRIFWHESLAYLTGPWALWMNRRTLNPPTSHL
jgi:hypothetical protein